MKQIRDGGSDVPVPQIQEQIALRVVEILSFQEQAIIHEIPEGPIVVRRHEQIAETIEVISQKQVHRRMAEQILRDHGDAAKDAEAELGLHRQP